MRAPAFWWQQPGVAAALLRPFGALYGAVAGRRLAQRGETAEVPVVCFGDFTLGGAGKTPAAIAAARLLAAAGERPAFLTRGYGGRSVGPIKVDPAMHVASAVGDEALLLARAFPAIVAHDRVAGAALAHGLDASVVIMDDGFHNPSLAKDCAVLVLDAARGLGNGLVFPAGPLRAPLAAQLQHAHAMVTVGAGDGAAPIIDKALALGLKVFASRIEPDPKTIADLRSHRVLAFAGIGNPEKFFATLEAEGVEVVVRRAFADHHAFTSAEAYELQREVDAKGLTLVTTEKDFVRLSGEGVLAALRGRTKVLPITMRFDDEETFRDFLLARLRRGA